MLGLDACMDVFDIEAIATTKSLALLYFSDENVAGLYSTVGLNARACVSFFPSNVDATLPLLGTASTVLVSRGLLALPPSI